VIAAGIPAERITRVKANTITGEIVVFTTPEPDHATPTDKNEVSLW
jgi:hypothetical protein